MEIGCDPLGVNFFDAAIKEYLPQHDVSDINVLDFGCGKGKLVEGLSPLGYKSYV